MEGRLGEREGKSRDACVKASRWRVKGEGELGADFTASFAPRLSRMTRCCSARVKVESEQIAIELSRLFSHSFVTN